MHCGTLYRVGRACHPPPTTESSIYESRCTPGARVASGERVTLRPASRVHPLVAGTGATSMSRATSPGRLHRSVAVSTVTIPNEPTSTTVSSTSGRIPASARSRSSASPSDGSAGRVLARPRWRPRGGWSRSSRRVTGRHRGWDRRVDRRIGGPAPRRCGRPARAPRAPYRGGDCRRGDAEVVGKRRGRHPVVFIAPKHGDRLAAASTTALRRSGDPASCRATWIRGRSSAAGSPPPSTTISRPPPRAPRPYRRPRCSPCSARSCHRGRTGTSPVRRRRRRWRRRRGR